MGLDERVWIRKNWEQLLREIIYVREHSEALKTPSKKVIKK